MDLKREGSMPRLEKEGLSDVRRPAGSGGLERAAHLVPLLYEELRRLAQARIARLGPDQTLSPTELVHETYLRISSGQEYDFEGRRHFFFAASRAMRDILVERVRHKASLKRGGGYLRVAIDGVDVMVAAPREDLLDVDRALAKLERECPDRARVVELIYFGGLTAPETAEVMGMSLATVERRWSYARAWLRRELSRPADA
jgi:RNA polymerase sigma factor (TIGR02999 family)